MRLSVDQSDVGFQPWALSARVLITLDGARVRDVVTADEEAGFVIVRARNEAGRYYEDPARPGHAASETRTGVVVIEVARRYRRLAERRNAPPRTTRLSAAGFTAKRTREQAQRKARAATRRAA